MQMVTTKYGNLYGLSHLEQYADGSVKECTFNEENKISTLYGDFIPQYGDDGVRRKFTKSVAFHKNGNLKSISLHERTVVQTPIGKFPAELITFYENGKIKRLFPLNGKITGYWTEENEYKLAQEFDFKFKFGNFRKKVVGIQFYESGAVKSLTFWPGETVTIATPAGDMEIRVGISLYPDGRIKSVEPVKPVIVSTPIGDITAFDVNPIGVHGDKNSLGFYEDGKVQYLTCSSDKIIIEDRHGEKMTYGPSLKPSLLQAGKLHVVPLQIHFSGDKVRFNNEVESTYETDQLVFTIKHVPGMISGKCGKCSGCSACG